MEFHVTEKTEHCGKTNGKRRRDGAYLFFKRMTDVIFSLFLTLLLTPLMLLIMLAILIRDGGNPFFTQIRMGKDGKPIRILKFRTMKRHAEDLSDMLSEEDLKLYREEYKLTDDPRLIGYRKSGDGRRCFGAILRRTSVDELPQLWWNVLLRGDMSLVGPRPILEEELKKHYSLREAQLFLSVKPGLTGFWQAYARNEACYTDHRRQEMELYYVANRSARLDLKILLRTVLAVITKAGAK